MARGGNGQRTLQDPDIFEELYGSEYKQQIIKASHPDWRFERIDGVLYLAIYDEKGLVSLNHGGAVVYRRLG
jgi:hypothetical protein